jgi:hypothetical protein
MNTKVRLIFSAMPSDVATWPYIGYDYESRASKLSCKEQLSRVVKRVLKGFRKDFRLKGY